MGRGIQGCSNTEREKESGKEETKRKLVHRRNNNIDEMIMMLREKMTKFGENNIAIVVVISILHLVQGNERLSISSRAWGGQYCSSEEEGILPYVRMCSVVDGAHLHQPSRFLKRYSPIGRS